MLPFLSPRAAILDTAAERCWSAADLETETHSRAERLSALGVGAGAKVAIAQDGTVSFFCDLLATWSLGASAACLDPSLTPGELRTVLDFLRPAIVADESGYGRGGADSAPGDSGTDWTVDAPALILFTSGTTASPKGVVLSYRALLARLSLNRLAIGDERLKRTLVTLPVHFGHGLIGNALTPLAAGGMVVLAERGVSMAANLGPLVDRHAITFMSSVPAFWRMALKLSRKPAGATLERVHVGSAPLPGALWLEITEWAACEVFNCYGMTETANWFGGASSSDGCRDNAVGRPWGGRAGVIGADGEIAPAGEGEIAVLTPCVMSGYLDRPDQTRAAFRGGWYRTGDFGSVDGEGAIVLTGRVKDEINRGGFKIQPAEIDRVVESHPGVSEACAFAIPDAISGEMVGIAVKLVSPAASNESELRAWCAARLRREATPERWFLVVDIPRNERGKVSRIQVRQAVTGIS